MTLIVTVNAPTGIVISGDSRTTITNTQDQADPNDAQRTIRVQTQIVASDSTNKVFIVHSKCGVAVSGDAFVNGIPVAYAIEDFEANASYKTKQNPKVNIVAEEMLVYFRAIQPTPNIAVFVCGYETNDPYVMTIDVKNNTCVRSNISDEGELTYGLSRMGDTDVTTRLIGPNREHMPPVGVMNLQDAADYSRHLIRSTIDQLRFERRFATVGGAIDTLLIDRNSVRFLLQKSLSAP